MAVSKDDINLMLISKFKMILPPTTSFHTSCAELRITPSKLVFNRVTLAEMGYPPDVCFLLSDDNTQIVVKASAKNEYSVPFCTFDEDGKLSNKMPLSINNRVLIQSLRNQLEWEKGKTYVVPAIKYNGYDILLFDLNRAYIRMKGASRSKTEVNILDSYPPMKDIVANYRQVSLNPHVETVEEPVVEIITDAEPVAAHA